MSITWLKLDHNIITDIKLRKFSPQEKWAWITLLCLASQSGDRGTITEDLEDIADLCDYGKQDFQYLLDKFKAKGMIDYSQAGIKILNWQKRQHVKPSDTAEATRERKRRQRANHKEMSRDVTPHVTPPDQDQDLDPDPEQIKTQKKKEEYLSSAPLKSPEPENRERGENLFPLTEEEFFSYIDRKLPQDGSIKNRVAYIRSVMKSDRETWMGIYLEEQDKRVRNDAVRAEATNQTDFAVNPAMGTVNVPPAARDCAVRRDNLRRQWETYPDRRSVLAEALRQQPELGLFVMDGQLCEFGEMAA